MIDDTSPKEKHLTLTPIHTLSFDELRERASRGEVFMSLQGYPISTRDHKWDETRALELWKGDVAYMRKRNLHLVKPILNKKGKPFTWSPSAISDFITCPMQYAAKRFYCTLPYVESEAMRQGTIEHKHLEDRLTLKKPLPEGYTRGEKFCQMLERATKGRGEIFAEREIAITSDRQMTSWFAENAWGRCKIDVTAVVGNKLTIIDWKSGRKKNNLLQLKVYACFLSLLHPDVETFTTKFVWLKSGEMSPAAPEGVFTRDQLPGLWAEITQHTNRMQEAWEYEEFHPRQSGLCRNWCAVSDCIHCGGAS